MKPNKLRNKLNKQSQRFMFFHYNGLGKPKNRAGNLIHSIRTMNESIRKIAAAAEEMGVYRLKEITPQQAMEYLVKRKNSGISQKELSSERRALERVIFVNEPENRLPNVLAKKPPSDSLSLSNRAYSGEQIREIITTQNPYHALSTLIAHNAGLRAEELYTLRRQDEISVSPHREWGKERFSGREGVIYIVTGKNGLRREVMLHPLLAEQLENRRLDKPKELTNYKCRISSYYDICGGNNFSKAFGRASMKVLDWSKGAHGLRFSYAQERMDTGLINFSYLDAKIIVSEELGHFRHEITEVYLKS